MKKDGSIEKIYGREDPIKSDFELLPNPSAYDSEKENYEHFFAKLKLYDWLRATQRDNIEKDRIIDVIHIEKEKEVKDIVYLEFPVVYPYYEYIHDTFLSDENSSDHLSIYPKIDPTYFSVSDHLSYEEKEELILMLNTILKSLDNHGEYLFENDTIKLIIKLLKDYGIKKESVQEVFTEFSNEYLNSLGKGKVAFEKVIDNFYENNYNFEILKDSWLEIIQKDVLRILNPKIIYYVDLGIVHKGVLEHAIEIVNKSPVNIEKINYLLNHINSYIPIIIIPSNVILQQYMMPNHLYGYIYYKNGWFLRKKTGDVEINISSKKYRKLISFDDHGQRR